MIDETTIVGEGRARKRKSSPRLGRGEPVGRYVVLDELGRGGMGVVYSAFDPQLDRKVALKVLHERELDELGGSEGQPRLLREAQALAKLSHPNVIAVHDVGTVGEAVFIAMEFVDGITLSRWIETPRAWPEIVRVLIAAGRGLAAAHEVGIIHRDFKPDNVIIDRDGRPRVLDFGLARAASEGSGAVPIPTELDVAASSSFGAKLTETGALMGTPAYMAPEQYAGERVDARTDQFAFCVSAYEVLYGERPFAGDSYLALSFQISQGIIRDPPKDTRVPAWLRKLLLRGLASKPSERWPDMHALLDAMGRDPARRRRWVVAAVAGALTLAGLGAIVQHELSARAQPCTDAATHMQGVWDDDARAGVEAAFTATGRSYAPAAARAVTHALDEYASAWVQMHADACLATRVRGEQSDEVLSLRMACLERQRDALAALVMVYREADAEVVDAAIEAIEALPPLSMCADTEGLLSGVRPPETQAEREQVEQLRRKLDAIRSLERAGKRARAREQLATLRAEVDALGYRPLIAELELAHGPMLDNPRERVQSLERALALAEATRHDRVAAQAWLELIDAYGRYLNEFAAADRAVALADAALLRIGDDEQLRLRHLVARGTLLAAQDELEQARTLLREARELRVRLGQAFDPLALDELVALSNVEMSLGHAEQAGPALREAVRETAAKYGDAHPWVARLRSTLGRVHYMAGDYAAAEADLAFALAVFEATYGPSINVAGVLNGLALVRTADRRYADALAAYERALVVSAEVGASKNLTAAKVLGNMSWLEQRLGRTADAVAHAEQALAITRAAFGEHSTSTAIEQADLAVALRAHGETERAEQLLHAAEREIEALEGRESKALVSVLYELARLALEQGRASEGRELLERAWTIAQTDPEHEVVTAHYAVDLGFELAQVLDASGEPDRALALAEQALTLARSQPRDQTDRVAEIEAWLKLR